MGKRKNSAFSGKNMNKLYTLVKKNKKVLCKVYIYALFDKKRQKQMLK